jgi:serine/threonine-protein kinase
VLSRWTPRANVYVKDFGTNQMWKLAAGADSPTTLPFNSTQSSDVAVDTEGNVHVLDSGDFRVLKLPRIS